MNMHNERSMNSCNNEEDPFDDAWDGWTEVYELEDTLSRQKAEGSNFELTASYCVSSENATSSIESDDGGNFSAHTLAPQTKNPVHVIEPAQTHCQKDENSSTKKQTISPDMDVQWTTQTDTQLPDTSRPHKDPHLTFDPSITAISQYERMPGKHSRGGSAEKHTDHIRTDAHDVGTGLHVLPSALTTSAASDPIETPVDTSCKVHSIQERKEAKEDLKENPLLKKKWKWQADYSGKQYMKDKTQKLDIINNQGGAEHFCVDGVSPSNRTSSSLFKGKVIYVTGYTEPSADQLKVLVLRHGGKWQHYFRKSECTHIIATAMSFAKQKTVRHDIVVHPDWLIESIKVNRVLPVATFLLLKDIAQSMLSLDTSKTKAIVGTGKNGGMISSMAVGVSESETGVNLGKRVHENTRTSDDVVKKLRVCESVAESPNDVLEQQLGVNSTSLRAKIAHVTDTAIPISMQVNRSMSSYTNIFQPMGDATKELDSRDQIKQLTSMNSTDLSRPASILKITQTNIPVQSTPTFASAVDALTSRCLDNEVPMSASRLASTSAKVYDYAHVQSESNRHQNKALSSLGNKRFVSQFFEQSRLSHLSRTGAAAKAYTSSVLKKKREGEMRTPTEISTIPLNDRIIMHLDMDSFFVSVSLLSQPAYLKQLPVAVCHAKQAREGSSSEIASVNYPARKFGVKNGMSIGQAIKLCPSLMTVPYDYTENERISKQMYDIILSHTSSVEPVSIDELFFETADILERRLDKSTLNGKADYHKEGKAKCDSDSKDEGGSERGSVSKGMTMTKEHIEVKALEFAEQLRQEVFRATGCTASVGIGNSMLLARIATRLAKPNGKYFLDITKNPEILGEMPVENLPGVGWSARKRLNERGVLTVEDITHMSQKDIQEMFGENQGLKIYNYALGKDIRELKTTQERKTMATEISWGVRFVDMVGVDEFIQSLCEDICSRLQSENIKASQVTLKIKESKITGENQSKYLGHGPCNEYSKSLRLRNPTDHTAAIARICKQLYREIAVAPNVTRGVGIHLARLSTKPSTTESIYGEPRKPTVNGTMDYFLAKAKSHSKLEAAEPHSTSTTSTCVPSLSDPTLTWTSRNETSATTTLASADIGTTIKANAEVEDITNPVQHARALVLSASRPSMPQLSYEELEKTSQPQQDLRRESVLPLDTHSSTIMRKEGGCFSVQDMEIIRMHGIDTHTLLELDPFTRRSVLLDLSHSSTSNTRLSTVSYDADERTHQNSSTLAHASTRQQSRILTLTQMAEPHTGTLGQVFPIAINPTGDISTTYTPTARAHTPPRAKEALSSRLRTYRSIRNKASGKNERTSVEDDTPPLWDRSVFDCQPESTERELKIVSSSISTSLFSNMNVNLAKDGLQMGKDGTRLLLTDINSDCDFVLDTHTDSAHARVHLHATTASFKQTTTTSPVHEVLSESDVGENSEECVRERRNLLSVKSSAGEDINKAGDESVAREMYGFTSSSVVHKDDKNSQRVLDEIALMFATTSTSRDEGDGHVTHSQPHADTYCTQNICRNNNTDNGGFSADNIKYVSGLDKGKEKAHFNADKSDCITSIPVCGALAMQTNKMASPGLYVEEMAPSQWDQSVIDVLPPSIKNELINFQTRTNGSNIDFESQEFDLSKFLENIPTELHHEVALQYESSNPKSNSNSTFIGLNKKGAHSEPEDARSLFAKAIGRTERTGAPTNQTHIPDCTLKLHEMQAKQNFHERRLHMGEWVRTHALPTSETANQCIAYATQLIHDHRVQWGSQLLKYLRSVILTYRRSVTEWLIWYNQLADEVQTHMQMVYQCSLRV